jgi:phenylacetic acid degradation operon negative regulatory protein
LNGDVAGTMSTSAGEAIDDGRPVTARSVIASVLLPLARPELPGRTLVRCGELFGIAEGTCRVALSRMVAAGELELGEGGYRLVGPLLDRRARQEEGRRPPLRPWDGSWVVCVAPDEGRSAGDRTLLRRVLRRRRMGEVRASVWARPDNLTAPSAPSPAVAALVDGCWWFSGAPRRLPGGAPATEAVDRLWDLPAWAERSRWYRAALAAMRPRLEQGDTAALAPGFRVAAAAVRHLTADPLLPDELLPVGWPGPALRAGYDAYEAAYQSLLRSWLFP